MAVFTLLVSLPRRQVTPLVLSLLSTGFCYAAAAAVDNDVIPSDTRWAEAVDMDATDTTVIVNYNDDAEL